MSSTVDDKCKVETRIPCEVYSRIVGYLRPVQNWHVAKNQEFEDRKTFDMSFAKVLAEAEDAEWMKEKKEDEDDEDDEEEEEEGEEEDEGGKVGAISQGAYGGECDADASPFPGRDVGGMDEGAGWRLAYYRGGRGSLSL